MSEPLPKNVVDQLKGEGPAFVEMLTSKGWKLYDDYMAAIEQSYKDNAVHAGELAEREDARAMWVAVRTARALPQTLLAQIRELSSQPEPADTPRPPTGRRSPRKGPSHQQE